jgi:uncharacterized protein (TIGR02118 family)
MIRLTVCVTRLESLTRDQFLHHWLHVHAPLVRRWKDVLQIKRYVQLHSFEPHVSELARQSRGAPAQYDGVVQIWYDSLQSLEEVARHPDASQARRELMEDEAKFVDHSRSPRWYGQEYPIF